MKKLIYLTMVIGALALIVAGCGLLTVPPAEESQLDSKVKPSDCVTIKDGILLTSSGDPIVLGYDEWGYNYQAHMFEGYYCDSYRDADWCQPWKDVGLIMKWNDAWLSNKDCDGDELLDRHYGFSSYIGSGAWLTNHQWGSYDIVDELNIGDETSEVGHNLEGWSDIWDWGGGYGNAADLGYSLRLLMGPGDGCGEDYREAYFTMDTKCAVADKLILHHLDGSQDDNFSVYIWDGIDWELIDSYDSQGGGENWVTTEYTFLPRSGELKFKLVATGKVTTWCNTWGQVAFSWAKIESESPCYWDYFCKIVAAPSDATLEEGCWVNADGTVIGPVIWGAFAVIQRVYNDPCAGEAGVYDLSPAGPGFGHFQHLSVKK